MAVKMMWIKKGQWNGVLERIHNLKHTKRIYGSTYSFSTLLICHTHLVIHPTAGTMTITSPAPHIILISNKLLHTNSVMCYTTASFCIDGKSLCCLLPTATLLNNLDQYLIPIAPYQGVPFPFWTQWRGLPVHFDCEAYDYAVFSPTPPVFFLSLSWKRWPCPGKMTTITLPWLVVRSDAGSIWSWRDVMDISCGLGSLLTGLWHGWWVAVMSVSFNPSRLSKIKRG